MTKHTIQVTLTDLDRTIATLMAGAPEQFNFLQTLLGKLRNLMTDELPRYGLGHVDIKQALPEVPQNVDYAEIATVLTPDLSGLEPPEAVDRESFYEDREKELTAAKTRYQQDIKELKAQEAIAASSLFKSQNASVKEEFKQKRSQRRSQFDIEERQIRQQYREEFKNLNRTLRRATAQKAATVTDVLNEKTLKQWLPEFLSAIATGEGFCSINHRGLTVSLPDNRHRSIVNSAKAAVFLDATLSQMDLALKLGCKPEEIYVCRQKTEPLNNLTIVQVVDLGRMGMQRGQDQQRRAAAIVAATSEARAIDFKKFRADGAWWRDSRGVNDFEAEQHLILIGTPCMNIADLQAEYSVLTGCHDQKDPGFKAFVDRRIRADMHQAIGRLRANRRPDEQLQVTVLSNFDLGLPNVCQVKASDITIEAADKRERFRIAVQRAVEQLKEAGEKVTQTAIAALTNYSQQYISKHWRLLLSLLDSLNSKSSRNSTGTVEPEKLEAIAQVAEVVTQEPDTGQILQGVEELFFEWLKPHQWSELWQTLTAQAQTKILEVLLLTCPLVVVELQSAQAMPW